MGDLQTQLACCIPVWLANSLETKAGIGTAKSKAIGKRNLDICLLRVVCHMVAIETFAWGDEVDCRR